MQNLDTANKRLRFLRSISGLTRDMIDSKYKLPAITLKKWETGNLTLSDKGISKCLEIYRNENIVVTSNWLRSGIGAVPTLNTNQHIEDEQDLNYFRNSYPNCVIHTVNDNQMLPTYKKNDVVIGLIYNDNIVNLNGKDCIVLMEDNSVILRKVAVHGDKINLMSTNYLANEDCNIMFDIKIQYIAPVTWHRLQ